jgi:hypothetical protein
MSDLRDVGLMLEAAERAAAADDLTSADELLRDIARIQETELGPLHPDLAMTLNNRAIVAEKTGRVDTAERFYRQAVAIATASLPADDPMVAASRENLQAFCRARGLPIDPPAPTTPTEPDSAAELDTNVPTPEPDGATPSRLLPSLAIAGMGVAIILATFTFLMRSRDSATTAPTGERESPQTARRTEPSSPQAAERRAPNPAAAAPASKNQGQPSTVVPPSNDPPVATAKPPTRTSSSSAITLITAQLCRRFSTNDASWTCDPAVDPVSPGPIVLYTRVRSPADTVVVHRWYRGDTLQQSAKLTIRANPTDGYRTYSRRTVHDGEWRVEVRDAAGALLHDERFVVR